MKVVAFIPIKLNNQRLPNKNILPLGDKLLCDHLFETIAEVREIDDVYVYCSDESFKKYLPPQLTFLKRDARLDGFNVKGLEIIASFVQDVDADVYVLTHVTSPFMKKDSFECAIKKVLEEGYDSAFSTTRLQGYCWYQGRPVNYDPADIVRTQDLEPLYMENGGFFIFKKEVFTKLHRRIGLNPYNHVLDKFESIEIDTEDEYEFARLASAFVMKKY